jgi:hypothetical protein
VGVSGVAAFERKFPQGRGNGSKNASFEIRKASRARTPDSPLPGEHRDMRTARPTKNIFHDYLDARRLASRHGVSLFVEQIECRDVAREGVEYIGVLAGAV